MKVLLRILAMQKHHEYLKGVLLWARQLKRPSLMRNMRCMIERKTSIDAQGYDIPLPSNPEAITVEQGNTLTLIGLVQTTSRCVRMHLSAN